MRITDNWQAEMVKLKENWDSYGARPITKNAIRKGGEIIGSFEVVPTVEGGLLIEFGVPGISIEIEITPDGSVVS